MRLRSAFPWLTPQPYFYLNSYHYATVGVPLNCTHVQHRSTRCSVNGPSPLRNRDALPLLRVLILMGLYFYLSGSRSTKREVRVSSCTSKLFPLSSFMNDPWGGRCERSLFCLLHVCRRYTFVCVCVCVSLCVKRAGVHTSQVRSRLDFNQQMNRDPSGSSGTSDSDVTHWDYKFFFCCCCCCCCCCWWSVSV